MLLNLLIGTTLLVSPTPTYSGKCSYFRLSKGAAFNDKHKGEYYCALRFNYSKVPKTRVTGFVVKVENPYNGRIVFCEPVDWGPARWTGRAIDLSLKAFEYLGVKTDETVHFQVLNKPSRIPLDNPVERKYSARKDKGNGSRPEAGVKRHRRRVPSGTEKTEGLGGSKVRSVKPAVRLHAGHEYGQGGVRGVGNGSSSKDKKGKS